MLCDVSARVSFFSRITICKCNYCLLSLTLMRSVTSRSMSRVIWSRRKEERLQKGLFYINEILYWGTLSNNNAFIYKQNAFRFGWIYICSGKYVCTYILTNAIFAIDIVDCAIFHHKKYCDYWQERLALNSIGIMHIHTS